MNKVIIMFSLQADFFFLVNLQAEVETLYVQDWRLDDKIRLDLSEKRIAYFLFHLSIG